MDMAPPQTKRLCSRLQGISGVVAASIVPEQLSTVNTFGVKRTNMGFFSGMNKTKPSQAACLGPFLQSLLGVKGYFT